MSKIYQKTFPAKKNAGFTLIELLVVVLIIGILAAIALPQYEKAVMKSRAINAIQMAESVAKASEVYYMANGTYTPRLSDLDVDYYSSCKSESGTSVVSCDNYFMMNLLQDDTGGARNGSVTVYYCPNANGWADCYQQAYDFKYIINFNVHPTAPNERSCIGNTAKGIAFCKTLKL